MRKNSGRNKIVFAATIMLLLCGLIALFAVANTPTPTQQPGPPRLVEHNVVMFGEVKTAFYAECRTERLDGMPYEEGEKLFLVLMTVDNEGTAPVTFCLGENYTYGVKFVFETTADKKVHDWNFGLIKPREYGRAGFSTIISREDNLSKMVIYDTHTGEELIIMIGLPPIPPPDQLGMCMLPSILNSSYSKPFLSSIFAG